MNDQPDISDDGKLIHALAEQVNSLRAELAQVQADYTHLQDTSTQAGMELINERDGLRELLAQCRGELVDAEAKAFAAVLCIRCIEHISVPQQNSTEFSGGECGACIAAERDTLKQSHAKLLEDYENANAEADTLKGEVERLKEWHALYNSPGCDELRTFLKENWPDLCSVDAFPIGRAIFQLRRLKEVSDSHRLLLDELGKAVEFIASKSSCQCWDVPGMGSGLPYKWIGCSAHNSDDQGEWCLCCSAKAALTKYQQQCGEGV